MKREIDENGRLLYKFSHSTHQGGYLYAHKTKDGHVIENKEGLRNALSAIVKQFDLIDTTIKIYDGIFFLFFMMKPSVVPQQVIDGIQKNIAPFSEWVDDYVYAGIYDLQERFIREDLRKKWGVDYERG